MKTIPINTLVFSISLPVKVAKKLEQVCASQGRSRSAFITFLIQKYVEETRWKRLYKLGRKTAKKFKITSENNIDRILHQKNNTKIVTDIINA